MNQSGQQNEPSADNHGIFDRAMLDAINDVLFAFTPEGRIVQWNHRVNEVTGYSDEEIAAMHPVEFVPKAERAFVAGKIEEALREGQVVLEVHFLTKDGRKIPYEFTGSLLERDGPALICGAGRDISERVRRTEELRESERKYRGLFEGSNDGIAVTTPEGGIVDVNPAICALTGYSRDELLRMNVSELYLDIEDRERIINTLREDGEIRNVTVRARRKDGEIITCQLSSSARVNDEGNVESIQSIIRDVTEDEKVQRALEESEKKFRTLAEKALVGIYLMQDGAYQYVNPAYARMVERTPEELIGRNPLVVLHPDEHARAHAQVNQRYSGESDEGRGIYRMITKSGKTIITDINGIRINYRGRPAVIGTATDITDRRRMQREILQIQEAERRRIGHDLHDGVANQLSGVKMLIGAAETEARTACPDLVELLSQIRSQLQASVDSVRRLSRGLNPVRLEEGGLPKALERLASNKRLEKEGICRFVADGAVPELSDEKATHLYWITQEAVNNAGKHSGADLLEIQLRREVDGLMITVRDNGTGFDVDEVSGEVMGLRTMKYRAELLEGEFRIDSAPGEGTEVRVRVPVP